MSRDALPPVPAVQGTPARYDERTFARVWDEVRQTWVEPVFPAPLVRSQPIAHTDPRVPANARNMIVLAQSQGWRVRCTYACGWEMDTETGLPATTDVMEETGEETPKGRPAKRKIGEVEREPVDSIAVRVAGGIPSFLAVGIWVDRGNGYQWDTGFMNMRLLGWTELFAALKAHETEGLLF